jgi:curved DNA-binding protein CbpA
MLEFKDYYAILKISHHATIAEIKAAFKRQSKMWHPDRNPGIDTTKMMQDINEAKRVLIASSLKQQYDLKYFYYKGYKSQQQPNKGEYQYYHWQQQYGNNTPYEEQYSKQKEESFADRKHNPFFYQTYDEQISKKSDRDLISICTQPHQYQEQFIALAIIELHEKRKYDLSFIYNLEKSKPEGNAIPGEVTENDWSTWFGKFFLWCLLAALSHGLRK